MKHIFTSFLVALVCLLNVQVALASLQLASPITLSSTEIEYKEAFTVSVSVENTSASSYSGSLGLVLYDAGNQSVGVFDVQDALIFASASHMCTFSVPSWSELMAGQYYVSVQSKVSGGEWQAVDGGGYNNLMPVALGTKSLCTESTLVYECDFENELLGWTFDKADGISSGFAIGSAASEKKGNNALFVTPDDGATAGYTQDNEAGYVSVAYKRFYLEPGNYSLSHYVYADLSYTDSTGQTDRDYLRVALIPAQKTITPSDVFTSSYPSYVLDYLFRDYWYSRSYFSQDNSTFTVYTSGYYNLVYMFCASKKYAMGGASVDDIKIYMKHSVDLNIKMEENKEGCLFTWKEGFSEYRIRWSTECDGSYKYDTITANSYLVPYTKLRNMAAGVFGLNFYVDAYCSETESISRKATVYPTSSAFPLDTCPVVPTITAMATDYGLEVSWKGNSGLYDFKYGADSCGCSCRDTLHSITDSTFYISYNPSSNLSSPMYFFVRGICDNDTSLWARVRVSPKYPSAKTSSLCHATPYDMFAENKDDGIHLTWKGNAKQYEVRCQSEDEYYSTGSAVSHIFMANGSQLVIPYGTLTDTLYHFSVRPLCEADTGQWSNHISAYNIKFGDYCIPFYDLCGPNTVCTYGSYSSPYSNKGALDYRQKNWSKSYSQNSSGIREGVDGYKNYRSRHTLCFEGETDPRCENLLSTVPQGEQYSVRLGNWDINKEAESVMFTHKIDSGYKLVLLLKYAVVLQDPSHEVYQNPHFTLEILDENDVPLDKNCWYADFAADKNAEGWHTAPNDVVWKDWTTIGVNLSELSQYGDRIIKIRLTTKDCSLTAHYGYAYFTLQCMDGEMQGVFCGERPIEFEVAEGFKYRWYLMDDQTKTVICDSNVFVVQPTDTNSYYVDMISLENEDCYYTLKAYTLPRLPRPQASFKHAPHDCMNAVSISNSSYVYKIMLDGTHQQDGRVPIDSIVWDFGPYGISTEIEPQLIVPNEGDTFNVSLRVVANGCAETETYTLYIPAIGNEESSYTYGYMCEGDSYTFQGVEYTQPGTYMIDQVNNSVGCDSTAYLVIDFLKPEFVYLYDTVCFNMLPYEFYGQICQESGRYQHTLFAQSGCDSVYYILDLHVYDKLSAELNTLPEICSGDPSFDISYSTLTDASLEFSIMFSELAKAVGFVDTIGYADANGMFSVRLPEDVRPDTYAAQVSIDNHGCEIVSIPLNIPVLYSRNIITQRWNDFLGIKNAQYNGGYIFSDYQWYLNDQPISGHTATQIYTDGELLDFEGEYRVLLTREDDGKSIMTCAFTPTYFYDTDLLQMCTFVMSSETVPAKISQNASMYIYDMSGFCVAHHTLCTGDNFITMPSSPGVYMAKVIYGNGKLDVIKLVVK
jgi:hypothetical protein